jgi:hypothetical protein
MNSFHAALSHHCEAVRGMRNKQQQLLQLAGESLLQRQCGWRVWVGLVPVVRARCDAFLLQGFSFVMWRSRPRSRSASCGASSCLVLTPVSLRTMGATTKTLLLLQLKGSLPLQTHPLFVRIPERAASRLTPIRSVDLTRLLQVLGARTLCRKSSRAQQKQILSPSSAV